MNAKSKSKIFKILPLDQEDELDKHFVTSYSAIMKFLEQNKNRDRNLVLQSKINESQETENQVYNALMYIILTSVNGFQQILRLTRELTVLQVDGVELLLLELMRQIHSGDTGNQNIYLIENILHILYHSNNNWLFNQKNSLLVSLSCYTFLRLIPEHETQSNLASLVKGEIEFVLKIYHHKKNEFYQIGRDLIRLLFHVRHIESFKIILDDLNKSKKENLMDELLKTPTPKIYFQSRISPKMEKHLLFLLQQVKLGNHVRYLKWFFDEFLLEQMDHNTNSTNIKESLSIDIARLILYTYEQENPEFPSGLVPRWALLGWLIIEIKSPKITQKLLLSIFYDWFFFNIKKDHLKVLEPTIKLMIVSKTKFQDITPKLLDFLSKCNEYDPRLMKQSVKGVISTLKYLIAKKMTTMDQINSLYQSPNLPIQIQRRFTETFKELFGNNVNKFNKMHHQENKNNNLPLMNQDNERKRKMPEIIDLESNFKNEKLILNNNGKKKKVNLIESNDTHKEKNPFESIKDRKIQLSTNTINFFGKLIFEIRNKIDKKDKKYIESIDQLLNQLVLNYTRINNEIKQEIIGFLIIEICESDFYQSNNFQIIFEKIFQIIIRDNFYAKYERIIQMIMKTILIYDTRCSVLILKPILEKTGRINNYYQLLDSNEKVMFNTLYSVSEVYPSLVYNTIINLLRSPNKNIQALFQGKFTVLSVIVKNLGPTEIFQIKSNLILSKFRLFGLNLIILEQLIIQAIEVFEYTEKTFFFQLLIAEFSNRKNEIKKLALLLLKILKKNHKANLKEIDLILENSIINLLKDIEPEGRIVYELLTFPFLKQQNNISFVNLILLHWRGTNNDKLDRTFSNLKKSNEVKSHENYTIFLKRFQSFSDLLSQEK
ncbi:integrator complex subunit 3 [Anaeramoeba flamelloides]|uniref:Integrator complex subunit n=1 Tax=Anaeramoeba flamelloides TaxID=1746091 RepID=A0AAV7YBY8_9EUKA|nr:integrator complex subunit [Anaeramoeba flamelloides]KAJ6236871.1 integrator complex subunit 3 [Anaeramoeba flamelloides]